MTISVKLSSSIILCSFLLSVSAEGFMQVVAHLWDQFEREAALA